MTEIKELIRSFCEKHLNDELMGYALKLCDALGRKKKINLSRGKKEIWAASIICAIARLNFLFDKKNENYIAADTICSYFSTSRSTIGNKATQIEDACNLTIGAEGYCSKHVTDSLTFYKTPEGFIVPKNMIEDLEIVYEIAEGEDAKELERFVENQRRMKEQEIKRKQERRAEINREIAEKKRKNRKNKDYKNRQLKLFGD
ncbi:MAG: DUF6398 domain-containing protein [Candidatus Scalindua rubra]|uniref:DUF6398 domain-containing protein n=1 Tax=Candidatus Scalindua brodae TaxID=237368 RepID=A0A0B0EJ21_9BACT|nr:MAG: hypothetical protein SCABRO_03100 [Candidatus Scalindua brodae]MBZ0108878.1 DUF6398 domain-containing protein [Candidatus Scalindua rubra]TWU34652.1 hypothetical protein S225a_10100 [Candidatus Brocadiaceae bacterium S225]